MGLEDMVESFEKDATGQGGSDGDNNANNAYVLPSSKHSLCDYLDDIRFFL
jgi:hypothetical protein